LELFQVKVKIELLVLIKIKMMRMMKLMQVLLTLLLQVCQPFLVTLLLTNQMKVYQVKLVDLHGMLAQLCHSNFKLV
jgi:hypothetical protein